MYSHKQTCPNTCPLKDRGCYAKLSFTGIHWNKVSLAFNQLLAGLNKLPNKTIVRYGVAGDLPGIGDRINSNQLDKLASIKDVKIFAYTHKPVLNHKFAKQNREAIQSARRKGMMINLSADSLQEADEFKKLNIAPVVVVLPTNAPDKIFTPNGNKIIACPQQRNSKITCQSCQLCMKDRSVIVGFKAHGAQAKYINQLNLL